jgi:hypothetical protein
VYELLQLTIACSNRNARQFGIPFYEQHHGHDLGFYHFTSAIEGPFTQPHWLRDRASNLRPCILVLVGLVGAGI